MEQGKREHLAKAVLDDDDPSNRNKKTVASAPQGSGFNENLGSGEGAVRLDSGNGDAREVETRWISSRRWPYSKTSGRET